MARAGIYKTDVVRAKDALLKRGRHPSIDAIRIELGNTGSKGTIHRYLKEIEEEEGDASSKVNVGEALQGLVARLAERLEMEAAAQVANAESRHAGQLAEMQARLDKRQEELQATRASLTKTEAALAHEKASHQGASEQLTRLKVELAQLTAQTGGLQERLDESRTHILSLEQKHQQAHSALEHFRAASKEQRDRELRQHEQQVQFLQAELGKANASLADKATELRVIAQEKLDTLSQLQATRAEARQSEERLRELKPLKEQLIAQAQIVEQLRAQANQQAERVEELRTRSQMLEARNTELVGEVAAAMAVTEAKEQLVASVLARLPIAGTTSEAAGAA